MKFLLSLLLTIHLYASTTVTTFNLKWFGLGGELSGRQADEYRGPWLKEFLQEYLSKTQIFIFQEVVDKTLLSSLMQEMGFGCSSYNHTTSKHQFVVVCMTSEFSILPEDDDNNISFEEVGEVDNSKLRPAISGIILNSKTRKPLFHLLGVHLKAGKLEGETRQKQAKLLAERISSYSDKLPVVLIGDFNTYEKAEGEIEIDDFETLDSIFESAYLKRVKHQFRHSYKSFNYGFLFDHVYLSENTNYSNVSIFSACNQSFSNSQRYKNINFYNRFISDHCPLSIDIQ